MAENKKISCLPSISVCVIGSSFVHVIVPQNAHIVPKILRPVSGKIKIILKQNKQKFCECVTSPLICPLTLSLKGVRHIAVYLSR